MLGSGGGSWVVVGEGLVRSGCCVGIRVGKVTGRCTGL